ncbi:unnamed protein product [Ectocarpus sp. CCAP 1310/34]|nr:unnamed protein product [Ectocarpus sp. CCAP 1310/34]
MPGDTPASDSGGTTIDTRATELSMRLGEQSKVLSAVMEKLGQLQTPPARAAGAEVGESSGAGNAAGHGGAAPGTRFGVPPGGVGGVGPPGHPSAAPPLGSIAQGFWMQGVMDKMSSLLQAMPDCGSRGGPGGAGRRAASCGGIVGISPPGSCLSELHAAAGVRTDDAAGRESSSRSGTEGEPVRALDVPANGGFGGFQTIDFFCAVGSSSRGAAGGRLTAPGTRNEDQDQDQVSA